MKLLIVLCLICGALGQFRRVHQPYQPYPYRRHQIQRESPPVYRPQQFYVQDPYNEEEEVIQYKPTKKPILKHEKIKPTVIQDPYEPVERVKKQTAYEVPEFPEREAVYAVPEQYAEESQQPGYGSEMDQDINALKASTIEQSQTQYGGYDDNGAKSDKRLLFQIHGQQGPHSYRFGYDTGKGYNRHFRYEERDGYGNVKGRYGFYDQYGELHVVNYAANPKDGFSAAGDFGQYPN